MQATTHRPIREANVWTARDLGASRNWTYELTAAAIDEIECAMRAALASGKPPERLSKADFPLPETARLLAAVHRDLEDGRGFAVVSGWPVERFGYAENVAAFCGVSAHFGCIKVQNYEGDWIVDVRDEGVEYSHRSRGYRSSKRLPFHTDGADLVGLLCLGEAERGGRSLLMSATNLFNVALAERPDCIPLLERGFYHHRRRQHPEGENPISSHRIPVFSFNGGYLHCCYNRNPIDWVTKEGMTLSAPETEALDYFDSVLARQELHADMHLRKGDMQFVNNFVILHSRTEYEDGSDRRRHLVRLWLENPHGKRAGEGLLDLYVPGTSRYRASAST